MRKLSEVMNQEGRGRNRSQFVCLEDVRKPWDCQNKETLEGFLASLMGMGFHITACEFTNDNILYDSKVRLINVMSSALFLICQLY